MHVAVILDKKSYPNIMQVVKEWRLSYGEMYTGLWWVSVKELSLCGIYGDTRR